MLEIASQARNDRGKGGLHHYCHCERSEAISGVWHLRSLRKLAMTGVEVDFSINVVANAVKQSQERGVGDRFASSR